MGWKKTLPRADVVQDELLGAPSACARAGLDRSRVSAISRFLLDQFRRAARGEERVDVLGDVCVRGFVHQERQAAGRRGHEGRELHGGGGVAEDGELSGRGERRGFVEDEADAGVCTHGAVVERQTGKERRHGPRWTSGPAHTYTAPLGLRPSANSRQYPSASQSTSCPGSSLPCRTSSVQGVRGSVGVRSSWTA